MKFFYLLAVCISLCAARPGTLMKRDGCPADYAACSRINGVLGYCYDLLSGPVYGWPGSDIGNAEGPKPYTAQSIHLTSPYMLSSDINCVCGAEGTTPSGWDAADKCYFCEIPGMSAADIAEYTALIGKWVVTCNTWGKVSVASAVTCWNSDLAQGCWQPSS